MNISIEKLIEIVIREVIKELLKQGVKIDSEFSDQNSGSSNRCVEIDMSEYKTPVLTENQLLSVGDDVKEIIIPEGTIITPVANEIIKKRNLIINKTK